MNPDQIHDCEVCHMKPGSSTARVNGCTCPVVDNRRGHQDPMWMVVTLGCPVHSPDWSTPHV